MKNNPATRCQNRLFGSKFSKNAIFLLGPELKNEFGEKFCGSKAFYFLAATAPAFFWIDNIFGLMRKGF
jgi:hypothetical protein